MPAGVGDRARAPKVPELRNESSRKRAQRFIPLSPEDVRTTTQVGFVLLKPFISKGITKGRLGVVAHTFNSSSWEAEAEGLHVAILDCKTSTCLK